MSEEKITTQSGAEKEKEQKLEKPRFHPWIRAIAFLIVAVFLPEQVAWAIEYNPAVLYRNLPQGMQAPLAGGIVQGPVNIASELIVAENVKRSLSSLTYKTLKSVKLDDKLEVTNDKEEGIFLTKNSVDKIYQWLKDKDTKPINCGIQGLGYILKGYNVDASIEELSILTILTDILGGATNQYEGQFFVSLYSLAEVANKYGVKLYPAKLDVDQNIFNLPIPFIVHIKNPQHFALVQKVEDDKVWLIQNNVDKPFSLPKDTFLSLLSGYFLLSAENENASLLTKEESKYVKGAPGDWGGNDWDNSYNDFGSYTYNNFNNNYNNRYESSSGYDYNAVNRDLNITTPTYTDNSVQMTVYDRGKAQTTRELWGFDTKYTAKDTQGRNAGTVGFNTMLKTPVTEYLENGQLVRGSYYNQNQLQGYNQQTILQPGKNSVAIPHTGVNYWKDVPGAGSGSVTYASKQYNANPNIAPEYDDRATVWIAKQGYESYSMNLDTAKSFDGKYAVWNSKSMAYTVLNPQDVAQPGGVATPPAGARINPAATVATVNVLPGASVDSGFVKLSQGVINVTNAGVTMRPGSQLTWDAKDFKNGVEFIPGSKYTPTSTQNVMNFYSPVQTGKSLVVGTNMNVDTGSRNDMRWVAYGKTPLTEGLGIVPLQSGKTIHHDIGTRPIAQDLINAARTTNNNYGIFYSRSNEGIKETGAITSLVGQDNVATNPLMAIGTSALVINQSTRPYLEYTVQNKPLEIQAGTIQTAPQEEYRYGNLAGSGMVSNIGKSSLQMKGNVYVGINEKGGLDTTPTVVGSWKVDPAKGAIIPVGDNSIRFKREQVEIKYNPQTKRLEVPKQGAALVESNYLDNSFSDRAILSTVSSPAGIPLDAAQGKTYQGTFTQVGRYLESGAVKSLETRPGASEVVIGDGKLKVKVPEIKYSFANASTQEGNGATPTKPGSKLPQWNTSELTYGLYQSKSTSGRPQSAIDIPTAQSQDGRYTSFGSWDNSQMFNNATHTFQGVSKFVSAVKYDDKGKVVLEVIPAANPKFDYRNPNATIPDMVGPVTIIDGVVKGIDKGATNAVSAAWGLSVKSQGYVYDPLKGTFTVSDQSGRTIRARQETLSMENVGYEVWKGSDDAVRYRALGIGNRQDLGITNISLDSNRQPVLRIGNHNLFLSQASKAKESDLTDKKDDARNPAKEPTKLTATLDIKTGIANRQNVLFNINNFTSPYSANLSGDFRSVAMQLKSGQTGKVPYTIQVDQKTGKPTGLAGGIFETAGQKVEFDSNGIVQKQAGFMGSVGQESFRLLLNDAIKQKALVDARGYIQWNSEGQIDNISKTNFERIKTSADTKTWYGIDNKLTELADGRLSITAKDGKYSIFVSGANEGASAGGSDTKPVETPEPIVTKTSRKPTSGIEITKDGIWKGQSSFFVSSLSHNFTGSIGMDLRNYSGVSNRDKVLTQVFTDETGKITNRKYLDFGAGKKFAFDAEGKPIGGTSEFLEHAKKIDILNKKQDQRLTIDPKTGGIYYTDGALDARRTDISKWLIDLYTRYDTSVDWADKDKVHRIPASRRYFDENQDIKTLFEGRAFLSMFAESEQGEPPKGEVPRSTIDILKKINRDYVETEGQYWATISKHLNSFDLHTRRNALWRWEGARLTPQDIKTLKESGVKTEDDPRMVRLSEDPKGNRLYFPKGESIYFDQEGSFRNKDNADTYNTRLVKEFAAGTWDSSKPFNPATYNTPDLRVFTGRFFGIDFPQSRITANGEITQIVNQASALPFLGEIKKAGKDEQGKDRYDLGLMAFNYNYPVSVNSSVRANNTFGSITDATGKLNIDSQGNLRVSHTEGIWALDKSSLGAGFLSSVPEIETASAWKGDHIKEIDAQNVYQLRGTLELLLNYNEETGARTISPLYTSKGFQGEIEIGRAGSRPAVVFDQVYYSKDRATIVLNDQDIKVKSQNGKPIDVYVAQLETPASIKNAFSVRRFDRDGKLNQDRSVFYVKDIKGKWYQGDIATGGVVSVDNKKFYRYDPQNGLTEIPDFDDPRLQMLAEEIGRTGSRQAVLKFEKELRNVVRERMTEYDDAFVGDLVKSGVIPDKNYLLLVERHLGMDLSKTRFGDLERLLEQNPLLENDTLEKISSATDISRPSLIKLDAVLAKMRLLTLVGPSSDPHAAFPRIDQKTNTSLSNLGANCVGLHYLADMYMQDTGREYADGMAVFEGHASLFVSPELENTFLFGEIAQRDKLSNVFKLEDYQGRERNGFSVIKDGKVTFVEPVKGTDKWRVGGKEYSFKEVQGLGLKGFGRDAVLLNNLYNYWLAKNPVPENKNSREYKTYSAVVENIANGSPLLLREPYAYSQAGFGISGVSIDQFGRVNTTWSKRGEDKRIAAPIPTLGPFVYRDGKAINIAYANRVERVNFQEGKIEKFDVYDLGGDRVRVGTERHWYQKPIDSGKAFVGGTVGLVVDLGMAGLGGMPGSSSYNPVISMRNQMKFAANLPWFVSDEQRKSARMMLDAIDRDLSSKGVGGSIYGGIVSTGRWGDNWTTEAMVRNKGWAIGGIIVPAIAAAFLTKGGSAPATISKVEQAPLVIRGLGSVGRAVTFGRVASPTMRTLIGASTIGAVGGGSIYPAFTKDGYTFGNIAKGAIGGAAAPWVAYGSYRGASAIGKSILPSARIPATVRTLTGYSAITAPTAAVGTVGYNAYQGKPLADNLARNTLYGAALPWAVYGAKQLYRGTNWAIDRSVGSLGSRIPIMTRLTPTTRFFATYYTGSTAYTAIDDLIIKRNVDIAKYNPNPAKATFDGLAKIGGRQVLSLPFFGQRDRLDAFDDKETAMTLGMLNKVPVAGQAGAFGYGAFKFYLGAPGMVANAPFRFKDYLNVLGVFRDIAQGRGGDIMPASFTEAAYLLGGLSGASKGLKQMGGKFETVARTRYAKTVFEKPFDYIAGNAMQRISGLGKPIKFIGESLSSTPTLLYVNAFASAGIPLMTTGGDWSALRKSVTTLTYNLDTVVSSSVGINTIFRGIGAISKPVSNSVINSRAGQFALVKHGKLFGSIGTATGAGMYLAGTEIDSIKGKPLGNAIANTGLLLFSAGAFTLLGRANAGLGNMYSKVPKLSTGQLVAKETAFYGTNASLGTLAAGAGWYGIKKLAVDPLFGVYIPGEDGRIRKATYTEASTPRLFAREPMTWAAKQKDMSEEDWNAIKDTDYARKNLIAQEKMVKDKTTGEMRRVFETFQGRWDPATDKVVPFESKNDWRYALLNGAMLTGFGNIGRVQSKVYKTLPFSGNALKKSWNEIKRDWYAATDLKSYTDLKFRSILENQHFRTTLPGLAMLGASFSVKDKEWKNTLRIAGASLFGFGIAGHLGAKYLPNSRVFKIAYGTPKLLANYTVGTGYTMFAVIAPLAAVVEGGSYLFNKGVLPSTYTNIERSFFKNTFAAFWDDRQVQGKDGKWMDLSARKYDGAQHWWNKAAVAYNAGLFGTWNDQNLQPRIQERIEQKELEIGRSLTLQERDDMRAEVSQEFLGKLRVPSISEKFKEGPLAVYNAMEKTNLSFSAILSVGQRPLSELLGNIQKGDFGRRFRAVGEGFEQTTSLGLSSFFERESANAATNIGKRYANQFVNLLLQGTAEEVIAEQAIQVISEPAFAVLGSITSPGVAQQLSEIWQEVATPGGAKSANSATSFWRDILNGANVDYGMPGLDPSVYGRGRTDFEGNPALARQLADWVDKHQGQTIAIRKNGLERVFTVENSSDWKEALDIQAQRYDYNHQLNSGAITLTDLSQRAQGGTGVSDVDREAARYSLVDQMDGDFIAKLAHPASSGVVVIPSSGIALPRATLGKYITERLAFNPTVANQFDQAYRNHTIPLAPLSKTIGTDTIFAAAGNNRTAVQDYIDRHLRNGGVAPTVAVYQLGNQTIEVRTVRGMDDALQTKVNSDIGKGAGTIGKDGRYVIFVDEAQWQKAPDVNNPLNNPIVNHEKTELAREVRMGRKLTQLDGIARQDITTQRAADRLLVSPQFEAAVGNAHMNAPELSTLATVDSSRSAIPLPNPITSPQLTTGPPVADFEMPVLMAASGGHETTPAEIPQSTPVDKISDRLRKSIEKLQRQLADKTREYYSTLAEAEREQDDYYGFKASVLSSEIGDLDYELDYQKGLAMVGVDFRGPFDFKHNRQEKSRIKKWLFDQRDFGAELRQLDGIYTSLRNRIQNSYSGRDRVREFAKLEKSYTLAKERLFEERKNPKIDIQSGLAGEYQKRKNAYFELYDDTLLAGLDIRDLGVIEGAKIDSGLKELVRLSAKVAKISHQHSQMGEIPELLQGIRSLALDSASPVADRLKQAKERIEKTRKAVWDLGKSHFAAQDYKGALDSYTAAEGLDLNDGQFLFDIAETHRALGDIEKAKPYYGRATRSVPGYEETGKVAFDERASVDAGRAIWEDGRKRAAAISSTDSVDEFEKKLKEIQRTYLLASSLVGHRNPNLLLDIADIAERLGERDQAIEVYRDAIFLDQNVIDRIPKELVEEVSRAKVTKLEEVSRISELFANERQLGSFVSVKAGEEFYSGLDELIDRNFSVLKDNTRRELRRLLVEELKDVDILGGGVSLINREFSGVLSKVRSWLRERLEEEIPAVKDSPRSFAARNIPRGQRVPDSRKQQIDNLLAKLRVNSNFAKSIVGVTRDYRDALLAKKPSVIEIVIPEIAVDTQAPAQIPFRMPNIYRERVKLTEDKEIEIVSTAPDALKARQALEGLPIESIKGFRRIVVDDLTDKDSKVRLPFKREGSVLYVDREHILPGVLAAAFNGKDGVIGQVREMMPDLLSANGNLAGTRLGDIAGRLTNGQRKQAIYDLVDLLQKANNGTGRKIGRFDRWLEARRLSGEIDKYQAAQAAGKDLGAEFGGDLVYMDRLLRQAEGQAEKKPTPTPLPFDTYAVAQASSQLYDEADRHFEAATSRRCKGNQRKRA